MLAVGLFTAALSGPTAARGAAPRRERPAAADTAVRSRPGEVGWQEIPRADDELLEPWFQLRPRPRLAMLWQTGYQRTFLSGDPWPAADGRSRDRYQFTHDLGLLVRGRGGHQWGGATTLIWQGSRRTLYAVKGIRRWSLEPGADVYFQVAPGVIVGGEEDGRDIAPGALCEAELGSRWVALTAGVHAVGWRANVEPPLREPADGRTVTWYVGGRAHGAVGLGIYLGLVLIFAATYRGRGWD
jgi:hypothetical protein